MAVNDLVRQCRDGILNNKLVTILSVALFAFIISTIALASSNQNKKEAIEKCRSEIVDLSPRCSVNPAKDLPPENEPVYLKHDGSSLQLWAPKGSTLVWNTTTEQTALLCSGTGNALEKTDLVLTEKTCLRGTQFTVAGAGDPVGSKDLKCKAAVVGECGGCLTSDPVIQCGSERGVLKKLGFNAAGLGFITYIEACFNPGRSSVLYTRHILPGAAIANAVLADEYQTWKSDGFENNVNPDKSYTQEAQVERLTTLLGSKEQAEKFVKNGTIFLNKGHLTPRGDGVFHTWKHATYFYMNAVPQWNVINDGNWKSVETRTRAIASQLQEDMIVIQGTRGVLSLPNTESQSVEVSLEAAGIDVPLWLWKIVKSPSRDAGIAFVTLNNPHETKQPESLLCPNVCDQYGWAEKQYSDLAKGFTYCCDPNALIRMVPHAPEEGMVKNVLSLAMLSGSSNGIALQAWVHMLSIVGLVHIWRILV